MAPQSARQAQNRVINAGYRVIHDRGQPELLQDLHASQRVRPEHSHALQHNSRPSGSRYEAAMLDQRFRSEQRAQMSRLRTQSMTPPSRSLEYERARQMEASQAAAHYHRKVQMEPRRAAEAAQGRVLRPELPSPRSSVIRTAGLESSYDLHHHRQYSSGSQPEAPRGSPTNHQPQKDQLIRTSHGSAASYLQSSKVDSSHRDQQRTSRSGYDQPYRAVNPSNMHQTPSSVDYLLRRHEDKAQMMRQDVGPRGHPHERDESHNGLAPRSSSAG